jgi:lauroyl/myristoyl acyltransferase
MSLPAVTLAVVQSLPASAAVLVTRLLVLCYLAVRSDYRSEIRHNYRVLMGRDARWFWLRNGWCVGRNLALSARMKLGSSDAIVDTAMVCPDNITQPVLERKLHMPMASFHFGLWEYLPQVFASRGVPVSLVTGEQPDPVFQRAARRLRGTRGVRVVRGVRDVARAMSGAGISGFMLDNTSQGNQQWVVTDGVSLRLPTLAFRLAERHGQAVTVMFARMGRGGLRIDAAEPGDARAAAGALLYHVRSHPEEWVFWGKAGAVRPAEAA